MIEKQPISFDGDMIQSYKDYCPDPNDVIYEFDDSDLERTVFQQASLDYEIKCVIDFIRSLELPDECDGICEVIDDIVYKYQMDIYDFAIYIKKLKERSVLLKRL